MKSANEVELGSNRTCAEVCFVKNPKNFFVRLDDHKTEYFSLIQDLQTEYFEADNNIDFIPKSLIVGSIYCTFNQKLYEWHRCEILRVNEKDALVSYIDIGSKDLVPIKSLKRLKDQFKKVMRFAINCALNNVRASNDQAWPLSTISVFSNQVLGKTVTLTFKSKLDNIFNVEMFLKNQDISEMLMGQGLLRTGESMLNLSEINNLETSPKVELKVSRYPRPVKIICSADIEYEMEVTHIYSPYCFYVQLCQNRDEFLDFEEDLQGFYEKVRPDLVITKPRVGQMCIAKYLDDERWYRAIIKEVDRSYNTVKVFFVDYGNEELLQIEDGLMTIDPKFVDYPTMGILCCLDKIQPTPEDSNNATKLQEIVNYMNDLIYAKTFGTFICKQNSECYKVDLKIETANNAQYKFINLSESLVEKDYAKYLLTNKKRVGAELKKEVKRELIKSTVTVNPEAAQGIRKYAENELKLHIKEKYLLTVTHIETLSEFYVQRQKEGPNDELRLLMAKIQYFYEKKINLPQPLFAIGNACVYYDDEKKTWYRAVIVHILDTDHCIIRLVDQGSSKYVNRSTLRGIYEPFLQLPCQVAQASMNDINEMLNLSEVHLNKFKEIALNRDLLAKVCNDTLLPDGRHRYHLNLFDENGESVFMTLINDYQQNESHSQMEESMQSAYDITMNGTMLDSTINNSTSIANRSIDVTKKMGSENNVVKRDTQNYQQGSSSMNGAAITRVTKSRPDHREFQQSIHDDVTSPFPVHEESEKPKIKYPKTLPSQLMSNNPYMTRPQQQTRHDSPVPVQIKPKEEAPVVPTSADSPMANKLSRYYYYKQANVDETRPYGMTIVHFESLQSFYAQIIERFLAFDELYDEFQAECEASKSHLTREGLGSIKDLDGLAIAAVFNEDGVWYRGKVITEFKNDLTHLLIEFVDYGNRQLTPIEDCILLGEKFAGFVPSAIRCNGVAYLETFDATKMENLVKYLRVDKPVDENAESHIWQEVYFKQNKSGSLIQLDELYTFMYRQNLIERKLAFNPFTLNEPICKQDIPLAYKGKRGCYTMPASSTVYDATLTNFSHGLKFIYFNFSESEANMQKLRQSLAKETNEMLVRLEDSELQINSFYLVRYQNELCRCQLLTTVPNQESFYQIHLLDSGKRVSFDAGLGFYVMPTRYFKYNTFAVHGRLTIATGIEKVWTLEERTNFYQQIKLNTRYKIKLLNTIEPYIFEFVDDKKINFDFKSIIKLALSNINLDQQTCLIGNYSATLSDRFFLAGNFLFNAQIKRIDLFDQFNQTNQYVLYLHSEKLLNMLEHFNEYTLNFVQENQDQVKRCNSENMKRGDLYLVKPKVFDTATLSCLKEALRNTVEKNWSRVQLRERLNTDADTKQLVLFFCDYGFEIEFNPKRNEFDIIQMPIYSKICPLFVFECVLNERSVAKKLYQARMHNQFCDDLFFNDYITKYADSIASIPLQADFTLALKQMDKAPLNSQSKLPVDLINTITNENLLNTIIRNGYADIPNYTFRGILSHINSVNDFYVQKMDEPTSESLKDLHDKIQLKVQTNQLKCLERLALDVLCVAYFEEDGNYYRAKITRYNSSSNMIKDVNKDLEVAVFYVDYGNTSTVTLSGLRAISSDLVDNYPSAFSIKCNQNIKLSDLSENDLQGLEDYFVDVNEQFEYDIKFIDQLNDVYAVEMVESESKRPLLELYELHKKKNKNAGTADDKHENRSDVSEPSVMQEKPAPIKLVSNQPLDTTLSDTTNVNITIASTTVNSSTDDDDKAVAESLICDNSKFDIDDTNCNNATSMTNISTFDTKPHKTEDNNDTNSSSEATLENSELNNEELATKKDTVTNPSAQPYPHYSWNETVASQKQIFSFNNTTLHCTQFDASEMDNSMQSTKNEIDLDIQPSLVDKTGKVETEIENEINEINEKNELNDESSSHTLNKSEQENTLYSTAKSQTNSMIIRGTEWDDNTTAENSTLVSINSTLTEDEWVEHKNCIVSFVTSSQSLYIQFSDFDTKIEELQPSIDASAEPYDMDKKPKLCVTLWEEDGLYYRCRIVDWNDDTNEAYVYFVDFGNMERVLISNLTAMPESLTKIQPLCVFSKLRDVIPVASESYKNFEQLVANEVRVNVKFRRDELRTYLESMGTDVEALMIKLYTADRDLEVNAATLGENGLWKYNPVDAEADKEEVPSAIVSDKVESNVDSTATEPNLEETNISEATQSTFNVTSVLEGLNEDSYIRKVDRKDISQFPGHDSKWFENKSVSDSTTEDYTQLVDIIEENKPIGPLATTDNQSKTEREQTLDSTTSEFHDENCENITTLADKEGDITYNPKCREERVDPIEITVLEINDTINDKCFDMAANSETQENPRLNNDQPVTDVQNSEYDKSLMAQSLIMSSELNSINISKLQNLEVSKSHYQSSNWSLNKSKLDDTSKSSKDNTALDATSMNQTIDYGNQSVSRFHDQSSNWTVNKSKSDCIGLDNTNDDQDSNWTLNVTKANESGMQKTLYETFVDNHHLNVSKFQDQDSNWSLDKSKLESTLTDQTMDQGNEQVSRFHDQSSNWTADKSKLSNTTMDQTMDQGNEQVSRFQDQSSNWTADRTHLESSTLEDDSGGYHAVTINSKNTSESWHSDPDQSTFVYKSSADRPRKVQIIHDLSELSKKLEYEEFIPMVDDVKEATPDYTSKFDGFILKVNSLDSFCVQLDDADIRLFEMKSELEKCRKPVHKNEIKIGNECVAPYHLDNQHYRAQIIEVNNSNKNMNMNTSNISFNNSIRYSDNKVKVFYIDYGNEDYVDQSELYRPTQDLLLHPPLAPKCKLNMNKNMLAWLDRMKPQNPDILNKLSENLKTISGKSKIHVKVIMKQYLPNTNLSVLLVDVFIKEQNICDLLIYATNNCINQQKIINAISLVKAQEEFDGVIVNYQPFHKESQKLGLECSVQNKLLLNLFNDLSSSWLDTSDSQCILSENFVSMALIPECLAKHFDVKNKYGRVMFSTSRTLAGSSSVDAKFVDYDYQCAINKSHVISLNCLINRSELPSSIQKYRLNLKNESDLLSLTPNQKEHLNEIFTRLVNNQTISPISSSLLRVKKSYDKKCLTVRLFDDRRDGLDVNCVLEMCIDLMRSPYQGHLTEIESDCSQFVMASRASMCAKYHSEMQKICRDTGLWDWDYDCKLEESFHQYRFTIGQIVLIDETPSEDSPNKTKASQSILVLNEDYNKDTSTTKDQRALPKIFRGIVIDESREKCVVQNIDTGKKIALKKTRIMPLNKCSADLGSIPKANSRILLQIIPFMLIKAKPCEDIICPQIKKILKNSRYYCEEIKLNIVGSWSTQKDTNDNQQNRFIQTASDLNKLVDFDTDSFVRTPLSGLESQEEPTLAKPTGSTISNLYKRKRSSEEEINANHSNGKTKSEEPSPRKLETINRFKEQKQSTSNKKSDYFMLSYLQSLSLFYVHSSEASQNLSFIGDLIQGESLVNRNASKLNRKAPSTRTIYGVCSNDKYCRVLLLNRVQYVIPKYNQSQNVKSDEEELYLAFYLDYGYTDQVRAKDLINISDVIQQIAPQAICCQLHGFPSLKTNFCTDADVDKTDPTENTILNGTESFTSTSLTNIKTEEEMMQATAIITRLLNNKPFMATVYKRFATYKKIDNRLPLQADNNCKPIEIVIHLFQPNEFESMSLSDNYIDEINENKEDLKFRNVTFVVKHLLNYDSSKGDASKRTGEDVSMLEKLTTQITTQDKIVELDLKTLVNEDQETSVLFGNLTSPNQFYLLLDSKSLTERMKKDYDMIGSLASLNESELFNGRYCVFSEYQAYKRAKILKYDKCNNLVTIWLVDFGKACESTPDKLFNLLRPYYNVEPLCFECTFEMEYPCQADAMIAVHFKSLVEKYGKVFKMKLKRKTDKTKYLIDLFAKEPTSQSFAMNIRDELTRFIKSTCNGTVKAPPKTTVAATAILEPFVQDDLPLDTLLKVQLTTLDTVKHFGIVALSDVNKRAKFMSDFHKWHRENKKSLKLIIDECKKPLIGTPCSVNSVQIGKWCRGIVANSESQMSQIYLVDHCRTQEISNKRIFILDRKEFIEEPIRAHRCQLIDSDLEQRKKLEKYFELMKSTSFDLKNSSVNGDCLQTSYIAIDNVEIQIKCLSKAKTTLHQMTSLRNTQYTISVLDWRKIRQSFPVSPFANINANQTNQAMKVTIPRMSLEPAESESMVSISLANTSYDDTTMNETNKLLCNGTSTKTVNLIGPPKITLGKNISSLSADDVSIASSNINNLNANSTSKNLFQTSINMLNYTENDTSFTNFSCVTESTRIETSNQQKSNQTVNNDNTIESSELKNNTVVNSGSLTSQIDTYKIDKRGETSNWIKDLDDDKQSVIEHAADLEPGSKKKVRIVPNTFSPSDFVCQRLDMLSSYSKLNNQMNEYYKSNAANSCYSNSADYQNQNVFYQKTLMDSLDMNSDTSLGYVIGDHCAAFIKNTWHRCFIIDITKKIATIECVDDCRRTSVEVAKLEKLHPDFLNMKQFAFRCKLSGLSSKLLTINKKAIEKFNRTIREENKELIAEIVEVLEEDSHRIYEIKLYIDDRDITDWLCEEPSE